MDCSVERRRERSVLRCDSVVERRVCVRRRTRRMCAARNWVGVVVCFVLGSVGEEEVVDSGELGAESDDSEEDDAVFEVEDGDEECSSG